MTLRRVRDAHACPVATLRTTDFAAFARGTLDVTRQRMRVHAVVIAALVVACAEDAELPPQSPSVVQNISYTTNVYTAASATVTTVAPEPTVVATVAPTIAPTITPRSIEPRTPPATSSGIAECDAYLARIESCTEHIAANPYVSPEMLPRIRASLDTTRRAWRDAGLTPSARAATARTCADSLRQYEASTHGQC